MGLWVNRKNVWEVCVWVVGVIERGKRDGLVAGGRLWEKLESGGISGSSFLLTHIHRPLALFCSCSIFDIPFSLEYRRNPGLALGVPEKQVVVGYRSSSKGSLGQEM